MPENSKKKIIVLGAICLLLIALIVVMQALPRIQVLRHQAAGSNQIKYNLTISNGWTLAQNTTKPVSVTLNNTGANVTIYTVGAEIEYNSAHFLVDQVGCASGFGSVNTFTTDSRTGYKKVVLTCYKGGDAGGLALNSGQTVTFASFRVKAIGSVGQKSNLDFISTLIPNGGGGDLSDAGTDHELTIVSGGTSPTNPPATNPPGQQATNTPIPTNTPVPSGDAPVINFKVKFQGVTTKKPDQKVKIIIRKDDFEKVYEDIAVTSNDDGLYSGSFTAEGTAAGSGYTFYVKGGRHVAVKYIENNQSQRARYSDTGRITLAAGANNLDFSKLPLPYGDLPNPNDSMKQDGVINAVDYSLLKARLGNTGEQDIKVADCHFDNSINVACFLDMRINLETLYGPEM
jgi:hypothetical protein